MPFLTPFQSLDEPSKEILFQEELKCSPLVASSRQQLHLKENEFIILKQYIFESVAQRTTITSRRNNMSSYHVYVKGAPEKIVSLCSSNTVPEDFNEILLQYTEQGFRIIAAAWRPLPEDVSWQDIEEMGRDELESDLEFLGLIILQNNLKPETTGVLRLLNEVNIRTIMVTGDNISTAISIARECEMAPYCDDVIVVTANRSITTPETLEVAFTYARSLKIATENGRHTNKTSLSRGFHFAIDGKSYDLLLHHNYELLKKITSQGTIFARMLPEQKMHLVESLQELGYQVGMCGDGANDCSALKAAHAGVALGIAEASIAAPFTSKRENISCIPELIREGRGCLVSCLGIFKFQVAYCFSQLIMALILFYESVKITDLQYTFMDFVLNAFPGMTFGSVGAFKDLVKEQPVKKLLAIQPLLSIFSFLLCQIVVYIITREYYHFQEWYVPYDFVPGKPIGPSYEGTSLFVMSCFTYLLAAIVFSQGPPYRQPLYKNRLFFPYLIVALILCSFLALYPGEVLSRLLEFKRAPSFEYYLVLFGIAWINCFFCLIWENYIMQTVVAHKVIPRIRQYFGWCEPYEHLQKELQRDEKWPPVNEVLRFDSAVDSPGFALNPLPS